MGTNYYAYKDVCSRCGRGEENPYHIGKSSAGWYFLVHVDHEKGIFSLNDIVDLIQTEKLTIKDEYGDVVTLTELLIVIKKRCWPRDLEEIPYGYKSYNEFLAINDAEYGLNGLIRPEVDGVHCVGHGTGTWSYIQGDFS